MNRPPHVGYDLLGRPVSYKPRILSGIFAPRSRDSTLAKYERVRHHNHSTCALCLRPWATVDPHDVKRSDTSSIFHFCKNCWIEIPTRLQERHAAQVEDHRCCNGHRACSKQMEEMRAEGFEK